GDLMHSIVGTETVAQADDEMFMLLNVAIASQHSGWIPTVDRDTDLSGVYEIEHVRVFQEVANGPYAEIPPHTTPIADIRVPSYDNTALDVDRVGGGPGSDIFRAPVPVTGSLEVTAHRPDYSGRVSVILSEMSNFNNSDGRFDKSPAIEEIVFDVQLDNVGDTQQLDYQFETAVSLPAVYSVDVLIKDLPTNNKKSLASNRVVQFLDVNQPGTTAFFEGFLREMTASFDSGQVTAEVPLQLQQAMLTPYLSVTYELVDTYSTDVLHVEEAMVEHDQVGMIALDTVIEKELDVEQSVALIVSVSDASGSFVLPRWGVHIEGTAPPPPGWTPDSGPVNPPVGGGTIPQLRWNATFVDNFDGPSLNPSAWIPNRDHIARRLQYYDKDALVLRDGHLDISVLNRPESDRPYTSGTVSTQGLFKQQFGYFEVRARIPKGNGFWPAFWLMPESGQWTSEIDIAEFRGQLPDNVHHAYHYGFRLRNENGRTVALNGDLSASYNNFAVYWTPERIDYLFNDVIVHSVTEATAVANANSEMYLILNLALSSHHASEWIPTVSEDTDLGQAFSIDYVRVYTADENGEYDGIPAFDAVVPDRQTPSYDNTALAVDRVDDPSYPDLLRSPQRIGGALELTSHRDNFDGLVTVMLVPVIEFNPDDGRFTKGPAVDTRNIPVALAAQGDQLILTTSLSRSSMRRACTPWT
ncbi:MAG: glycoside hydrolase family 16 protein, partial [Pseudomonadota bacterium]